MSKALKVLNTDAAYALGEEAFRAGWEARDAHQQSGFHPESRPLILENDWNNYEPSEAVKDLISDEV